MHLRVLAAVFLSYAISNTFSQSVTECGPLGEVVAGTWSSPECEKQVSRNGTTCALSCSWGFPSYPGAHTCVNGFWSPTNLANPVVCQPKCTLPPKPKSGEWNCTVSDQFGDISCNLICEQGFMEVSDNSSIMCDPSGTGNWVGSALTASCLPYAQCDYERCMAARKWSKHDKASVCNYAREYLDCYIATDCENRFPCQLFSFECPELKCQGNTTDYQCTHQPTLLPPHGSWQCDIEASSCNLTCAIGYTPNILDPSKHYSAVCDRFNGLWYYNVNHTYPCLGSTCDSHDLPVVPGGWANSQGTPCGQFEVDGEICVPSCTVPCPGCVGNSVYVKAGASALCQDGTWLLPSNDPDDYACAVSKCQQQPTSIPIHGWWNCDFNSTIKSHYGESFCFLECENGYTPDSDIPIAECYGNEQWIRDEMKCVPYQDCNIKGCLEGKNWNVTGPGPHDLFPNNGDVCKYAHDKFECAKMSHCYTGTLQKQCSAYLSYCERLDCTGYATCDPMHSLPQYNLFPGGKWGDGAGCELPYGGSHCDLMCDNNFIADLKPGAVPTQAAKCLFGKWIFDVVDPSYPCKAIYKCTALPMVPNGTWVGESDCTTTGMNTPGGTCRVQCDKGLIPKLTGSVDEITGWKCVGRTNANDPSDSGWYKDFSVQFPSNGPELRCLEPGGDSCGQLNSPGHGHWDIDCTTSAVSKGTVCQLHCDDGYVPEIDGHKASWQFLPLQTKCEGARTWTNFNPDDVQCTEVCRAPKNPPSGGFWKCSPSGNTIQCSLNCPLGTLPSDDPVVQCYDGAWYGNITQICDPPAGCQIEECLRYKYQHDISKQNTCAYYQDWWYCVLSTTCYSKDMESQCQQNKGACPAITCDIGADIPCGPLPNIEYGIIQGVNNNTAFNIVCPIGYQLQGSTGPNGEAAACDAKSGQWSWFVDKLMPCKPVGCSALSAVSNGVWEPTLCQQNMHQNDSTVCSIQCNDGYTINPKLTVTNVYCEGNLWIGANYKNVVPCVRSPCVKPAVPVNGYGWQCSYLGIDLRCVLRCKAGFRPTNNLAFCQVEETGNDIGHPLWAGLEAKCAAPPHERQQEHVTIL